MPEPAAPPEFLTDTLATKTFWRHAGEWDLALPPEAGTSASVCVLRSFAEAFGSWTAFAAVEAAGSDGPHAWDGRQPASRWLSELAMAPYGFEADVDLDLSWQDEAGSRGVARFPRAARLLFDQEAMTATLTIWPNFFCDEIYLYRRTADGGFEHRVVPFAQAAAVNRAHLRDALHAWAERSGGEISAWGSDLLTGVQQWGFSDDCALL